MNRRDLIAAGMTGTLLAPAAQAHLPNGPVKPDFSIKLWPGEAPGLTNPGLDDHVWARGKDPAFPDRAMDRIRTPKLDVFRAKQPNGAAILVIPGGGYERVVLDKEGYEVAPWLVERGITVFVLFYRLPGEGWRDRMNAPLADAQRAMRLIRSRAAEWRVDPKRVAAMGFSAGGHLCADLATRFAVKTYEPIDAADALDPRPMLAAPIYPVASLDPAITHKGSRDLLLGPNPSAEDARAHSPDQQVSAQTPPCFLMHAEDDTVVPVDNTIRFRAALRDAGVPVETHIFEKGGHGFGFGVRTSDLPVGVWPELYLAWARDQGLLG